MSLVSRPWRNDARSLPATRQLNAGLDRSDNRAFEQFVPCLSPLAFVAFRLERGRIPTPSDTIPRRCLTAYCTWALAGPPGHRCAAAQQPAPAATGYTIFLRGTPIGHEDVRSCAPTRRAPPSPARAAPRCPRTPPSARPRFATRADWTPESFVLEGTVNGGQVTAKSTFDERRGAHARARRRARRSRASTRSRRTPMVLAARARSSADGRR